MEKNSIPLSVTELSKSGDDYTIENHIVTLKKSGYIDIIGICSVNESTQRASVVVSLNNIAINTCYFNNVLTNDMGLKHIAAPKNSALEISRTGDRGYVAINAICVFTPD